MTDWKGGAVVSSLTRKKGRGSASSPPGTWGRLEIDKRGRAIASLSLPGGQGSFDFVF